KRETKKGTAEVTGFILASRHSALKREGEAVGYLPENTLTRNALGNRPCAFAYGCLPSQAADLGTDYHRPGVRHVRATLYSRTGVTAVPMRASTVSMPGTATSIIILGTIVHPRMRSRVGIIVDIFTRHSTAAATFLGPLTTLVTAEAAAHSRPSQLRARRIRSRRLHLVRQGNAHFVEMRLVRPAQALRLRHHDIARRWIVQHREFGRAKALDFVAQPRGLLEVEIGRRLAHARLKVGNHRLEIVTNGGGFGEFAGAGGPGGNEHVVALVHAVENVGDTLAHALRRDPIFRVVSLLLFAPPIGLFDRALH